MTDEEADWDRIRELARAHSDRKWGGERTEAAARSAEMGLALQGRRFAHQRLLVGSTALVLLAVFSAVILRVVRERGEDSSAAETAATVWSPTHSKEEASAALELLISARAQLESGDAEGALKSIDAAPDSAHALFGPELKKLHEVASCVSAGGQISKCEAERARMNSHDSAP